MSKDGTLNIVSVDGSSIEATMSFEPTQAKECSIWLLYLLNIPGFLERCSFKQNTQGRVKLKLRLRKRPDWRLQLDSTRDSVVSLTTKSEDLNGS